MKIGIIVHSYTGNTYSVAQKLCDKLLEAGHHSTIVQIKPLGGEKTDEKNINNIKFVKQPDVALYDALVIGAPVRGASISPVLAAYLDKIASLQGKKVACFVTEFFPFPWMGGNRAISQMTKACESKGAAVCGTGIVNWKSSQREKKINGVVEAFCKLF